MANPTTNYGWPMPTSTDLVTDLPADFAAFGQPVDTSLKALNPETTLGDIAYRSATSNTNTRLGIGTAGQVLAVSGGVPAWTTTADVTPLTTKGDLFTFTTVDARIGVGANNTVLTADSAEASGLKWATPAGGGKVLQVVSSVNSTEVVVASTTFTDTGITATITPTLNTSKILVLIAAAAYQVQTGATESFMKARLLKDSTVLLTQTRFIGVEGASSTIAILGVFPVTYLDSPATTSATTYKLQGACVSGGSAKFQVGALCSSTITLLEIGA